MDVTLTQSAPVRMAVLQALSDRQCLTLDQLEPNVTTDRRTLNQTVRRLIGSGIVERAEEGCFKLTLKGADTVTSSAAGKPIEAKLSLRDSLRQRAWNVMRMGDVFTVEDLACVCDTDSVGSLRTYCTALARAGYLMQLPVPAQAHRTGPKPRRFRLLKNTGMKAPALRRGNRCLYDFNTREEQPCPAQ